MKYPQPLTTFFEISINAEHRTGICWSIYDNKVIKKRPLQVTMSRRNIHLYVLAEWYADRV